MLHQSDRKTFLSDDVKKVRKPTPYELRLFGWIAKHILHGKCVDPANIQQLPAELKQIVRCSVGASERDVALLITKISAAQPELRDLLATATVNAPDIEQAPKTSTTLGDVASIIKGVEWLWNPWIPLGLVTLVIAEPGIGKSAFLLGGILPPIILGTPFPDGQKGLEVPRPAIWCDTESAHAMTIERVARWSLPSDRLLLPGDNPLDSISIDNDQELHDLSQQIRRENAPITIIDSLRSAHGGEENSSRDVGMIMKGLAEIAQDTRTAIVVVHHTRKIKDGQPVGYNAARGSNAIIAMARSVIALSRPDPEVATIRVEIVKSNVAPIPGPLGFTIKENGIQFCEPPSAASNFRAQSRLEEAMVFLREVLADGDKPMREIESAAKERGLSPRTLERAKDKLGIASQKKNAKWAWSLERDDPVEDC